MIPQLERCGVVTITTDFGSHDPYVGIMKGVILARCPRASLVDLTHDVPPFDPAAAGHVLARSFGVFPPGTVHLVVVDPGVGTDRDALMIEAGDQLFVGPGNGCLDTAARKAGGIRAFRIVGSDRPVSATFQGRDLFAPLAGHLAAGEDVTPWVEPIRYRPALAVGPPRRSRRTGAIRGRVVWIDRFGNLVTNLTRGDLGRTTRRTLAGEVDGRAVRGLYRTYGEAPEAVPFFVWGSADLLEVSVRHGSAAAHLGVSVGCDVRVLSGRS